MLIRIRIQFFTFMRIRIKLLFKVMGFCNLCSKDSPGLHFEPPGLHFETSGLHCERSWPSTALFFLDSKASDLNADPDPDPAFHCNANPDSTSKFNADPDLQLWSKETR